MNEKKTEILLNHSNHRDAQSGLNGINNSLPEYQSVFTKNLPKKTKHAFMCVFISVGKEHCSGAQFQSLLKLLHKTFSDSHIVFIIADKLQRFTYQLHGMNLEESESKAIQEGLAWKAQHEIMIKNTLSNLTYSFVHWCQLTSQNESYLNYVDRVNVAYREDENFRRKFDKTVTGFLSAQLGDKNVECMVNNELGAQLCLDYLKEECSAHLVLANQQCSDIKPPSYKEDSKVDYTVYPRSMSDAFEATYQKFIPSDVLIYLSVRNKVLKHESLLHETSVKKSTPSPAFFKSHNSEKNGSFSLQKDGFFPDKEKLVAEINILKTYMNCLKTVLNSAYIPTESKLQLAMEIIANTENGMLEKTCYLPSLTL